MNRFETFFFYVFQKLFSLLKFHLIARWTSVYNSGCHTTYPPKILILGSSFAKTNIDPYTICHFNPQYVLEDIVNFGQSMGGPYEMYVSVKKNLALLKETEYIYIGLDPHILGEKFYHYMHMEKMMTTPAQWEYLFHNHSNYMQIYHPDLQIRWYSPFLFWKNLFVFKCLKRITFQGYEPRLHSFVKPFDSAVIPEYTYTPIELFPVSHFELVSLQKLKNVLEKKTRAKIRFFLSPSYNWQYGYQLCNEYDQQLIQLLHFHLGQIEVVGSLYGEDFGLRVYDFYDNRHLAHSGAVKFTSTLFEHINQYPAYLSDVKPLTHYRFNYSIPITRSFENNLKRFKTLLKSFIADKKHVFLYGVRNTSRMILSLFAQDHHFDMIDSSDCLRSFPEFVTDNFVYPKAIYHISNIPSITAEGLVITNFNEFTTISNKLISIGIVETTLFPQKSFEFDFNYFSLQVNVFYRIAEYLLKHYRTFIFIGESIIIPMLIPLMKGKIQFVSTKKIDVITKESISDEIAFIIFDLNRYNEIEKYLLNLHVQKESIVSFGY